MMSPGSDGSSLDSLGHMTTSMEMQAPPSNNPGMMSVNTNMIAPMAETMTSGMTPAMMDGGYHVTSSTAMTSYPVDTGYMTAGGYQQGEYTGYYMGQAEMYNTAPMPPAATSMPYCMTSSTNVTGEVVTSAPMGEMITSDPLTAEVPGPAAQPVELDTSDVAAPPPPSGIPAPEVPPPGVGEGEHPPVPAQADPELDNPVVILTPVVVVDAEQSETAAPAAVTANVTAESETVSPVTMVTAQQHPGTDDVTTDVTMVHAEVENTTDATTTTTIPTE